VSHRTRCLVSALALLALAGCRGGASSAKDATPSPPAGTSGTPVQVAGVELASMAQAVSAPGRTIALVQQKVRAPFAGTLTELSVVVGDKVQRGEQVGAVVSRDSEAAVSGAEEMLRDAKTSAARADAERALALARENRIVAPLHSWVAGVVIDRTAAAGDRVAEDQELVTVASLDSLVFVADLAQSDLAQVHSGQPASVKLTGHGEPLRGVVHGLLANADAANSTAPIRIDLTTPPASLAVGMFGTASITVAHRTKVPVVPKSAVLTDDVSGVRRLAEVIDGKAHWVDVQTGLSDSERIEITSPVLTAGTRVIVGGQVGLPEGTPVVVRP
jgi:RND family efflux transporter MFP subunit